MFEPRLNVFRLGDVQHHLDIGIGVAHRLYPGVEQLGIARPIRQRFRGGERQHIVIDLVADLHVVRRKPGLRKLLQRVGGELINCLGQRVVVLDVRPCRRNNLLAGIGPVVGIMEIEQNLHALRLGAGDGTLHVVERAILGPAWVVPKAQPHQIGAEHEGGGSCGQCAEEG